jgi:hypothetical protein
MGLGTTGISVTNEVRKMTVSEALINATEQLQNAASGVTDAAIRIDSLRSDLETAQLNLDNARSVFDLALSDLRNILEVNGMANPLLPVGPKLKQGAPEGA